MTLKEKVAMEEPKAIRESCWGGVECCPGNYGYLHRENLQSHMCSGAGANKCEDCWNQEFVEPKTEEKEDKPMNFTMEPKSTKKTKAQLIEEINGLNKELARMDKYRQYEEAAGEMYAILESFMNAGFTREEAFTMIVTSMKTNSTARR